MHRIRITIIFLDFADVILNEHRKLILFARECQHIGSVVMSVARPNLTGKGISVTSSVLNGLGHTDEFVARKFAEAVAKKYECTAVCSCGIHVDGITAEGIEDVGEKSEELFRAVMEDVGTLQE